MDRFCQQWLTTKYDFPVTLFRPGCRADTLLVPTSLMNACGHSGSVFFTTLNQSLVTGNIEEEEPSSGGMIISENSWTMLEFCCLMQMPLLQTAPCGECWRRSQRHFGMRIKLSIAKFAFLCKTYFVGKVFFKLISVCFSQHGLFYGKRKFICSKTFYMKIL